jgi:hypothetical protein
MTKTISLTFSGRPKEQYSGAPTCLIKRSFLTPKLRSTDSSKKLTLHASANSCADPRPTFLSFSLLFLSSSLHTDIRTAQSGLLSLSLPLSRSLSLYLGLSSTTLTDGRLSDARRRRRRQLAASTKPFILDVECGSGTLAPTQVCQCTFACTSVLGKREIEK